MEVEPILLIQASAGSGKTHELTNRLLTLILAGERLDRILATTFTRKAAGEITERLFRRLGDAALSADAARKLREELKFPSLTSDDCRTALHRLCRSLSEMRISTLDSFFLQLARCYAGELGLPPHWGLAEDFFAKDQLLDCVGDLFEQTSEQDLLEILLPILHSESSASFLHRLKGILLDPFEVIRGNEELHELLSDIDDEPEYAFDASCVAYFERFQAPLTKANSPNKNWVDALTKLRSCLHNHRFEELLSFVLVERYRDKTHKYSYWTFDDEFVSHLRNIVEVAGAACAARYKRQTKVLLEFAKKLGAIQEEKGLERGALTFTDVKYFLSRSAVLQDLSSLYYRLDCSISHVLFDEFQDTSRREWDLLSPFVGEVISKADGSAASLFCVGDCKQAIYGWRGGDVSIFEELEEAVRERSKPRSSIETFRCRPAVTRFVNELFTTLGSNPIASRYPEAQRKFSGLFEPHISKRQETQGFAQVRAIEKREDKTHARYHEAAHLIQEIRTLAPWASIGVLFETNNDISEFARILASPPYSLEASREGAQSIALSPPVCLLLALLRIADHPGDTIARFHVACSSLSNHFQFSSWEDDSAALGLSQFLRRKLCVDGLTPTLRSWADLLMSQCNELEKQALQSLLSASAAIPDQTPLRLRPFIERIEALRIERANELPIRLLTVFKSKGLEFDVVILPELEKDFSKRFIQNKIISVDRSVLVRPNATLQQASPALEQLNSRALNDFVREIFAQLYVAVTRPRFALYALVDAPIEDKEKKSAPVSSFASLLRACFLAETGQRSKEFGDMSWTEGVAPPPPPSEREEAGTQDQETKHHRLQTKRSGRRRGLVRETPSDQYKRHEVLLSDELIFTGYEARNLGSQIHRYFQEVEWLEPGEAIPMELSPYMKGQIRSVLEAKTFPAAPGEEVEVWRERRFAVTTTTGIMIGAFDRIIVFRQNGIPVRATVIDFKTDDIGKDDVQTRKERYKPQLEAYELAASKVFRIPRSAIETKLAFVVAGIVC